MAKNSPDNSDNDDAPGGMLLPIIGIATVLYVAANWFDTLKANATNREPERPPISSVEEASAKIALEQKTAREKFTSK